MRHVTFYHQESGILNGVSLIVSDDSAVALNEALYPGHKAIDHPVGAPLDSRKQRVDVGTGKVLAWDAPKLKADESAGPTACPCPKHGGAKPT